jgi:hypothetical protein
MAKFKYEKFGNTTYFPSGSTVGNAQGDVTYIGGGEVTAGYIYYLSPIATLGTYEWTFADADFTTTSGGLLAVALGTGTSSTVGMLLRGMVTLAIAPQGGTTPGMNLYLSASAGRATTTAPTNDFPRTIGFTTTAAVGGVISKLIWFNTDNGFVGGLGAATGISFNNITALASTVSPVNGTAAVGTSTTVARQDHVHGTDTSRAPLASPTFTGTVVLPSGQALIAPALGTVASGNIAACTGLPIINGTTGILSVARGGTGVATSTGSGNVVLSTSPTLTTPILGTPQSGDLTSCTGTFQQITGITVDYTAWYLNSGLYEYDISNASITSNTVVDVIPDNADYTIVLAAQLLPANVSSAGEVKIFAVNEPTDDINVTLNLFK